MPLTDEEIKALRDKAQFFGLYVAPHDVQSVNCRELDELCTRLLSAEAKVKVLEEALRAIPEEMEDQNYHDVYAIVHNALTEAALIEELRDTISPAQDMQYTVQGDRQERAADTIERLIRERDEARGERQEAVKSMLAAIQTHIAENHKAEARGYERGVREAVEAGDPGTIAELCTRLLSAEAKENNLLVQIETLIKEQAAALARVKVLEEALRPFALPPETVSWANDESLFYVKAQHMFAARAALLNEQEKSK